MHLRKILELGNARPPYDRVPPRLSVPARAAVVDEHDREAVIDPGLHRRGKGILIVSLRSAVHDEDGRVRPGASRLRDEEVDAVHVELLVDRADGRGFARPAEHDTDAHRPDLGRRRRVRPLVPDVAVRTDSRRLDGARVGLEPMEPALREIVAVELSPSAVFVSDEKRTAVGIPLGECLTREIKLDVVGRVRSRVEDQRLAAAAPVVQHEQTLVATHRGPADRLEALARTVPELGNGASLEVDDADRAVAAVAVLGMRDREECLVGREVGDGRALWMFVDKSRRLALAEDVHRGALVAARPAEDREARSRGEPRAVRRREVGGDRLAGSAGEWRADPAAELVPLLVVEPPDVRT